jgi:hypothetical protein
MLRDAASKVMRVARATVFVVGITVVLALVLVAAGAAFGANGDFFKVGRSNLASAVSVLDKSGAGPALRLLVDSGAPMAVNSSARVANLNADQLDGKNQSAFADVNELGGQTAVHVFGPLPVERTFASDGGTLIVLASGSAFRSSGVADGPGRIAMNVRVDGSTRGRADGFADERGRNHFDHMHHNQLQRLLRRDRRGAIRLDRRIPPSAAGSVSCPCSPLCAQGGCRGSVKGVEADDRLRGPSWYAIGLSEARKICCSADAPATRAR